MLERFKRGIDRVVRTVRIRLGSRVVLGGGGLNVNGWVVTDKRQLDITDSRDFSKYWKKGTRTAFLAEHVWEHLKPADGRLAAENCYAYLKPEGRLRIAVPDGYHPSQEYINNVRPGGTGCGADDHRVLFKYVELRDMLEAAGFEVILHEYWDEFGRFHHQEMGDYFGVVRRSSKHDPRNQGGELVYTSIVADGVKR